MITYCYTHGEDADLAVLSGELDAFLDEAAGGRANRAQYVPLTTLEGITDAIMIKDDDMAVGCACLKDLGGGTAEVKRVFVRAAYRGQGLSKELLRRLEQLAVLGLLISSIRIFQAPLKAALGLYTAMGYERIAPFGPYIGMADSICLGKVIV